MLTHIHRGLAQQLQPQNSLMCTVMAAWLQRAFLHEGATTIICYCVAKWPIDMQLCNNNIKIQACIVFRERCKRQILRCRQFSTCVVTGKKEKAGNITYPLSPELSSCKESWCFHLFSWASGCSSSPLPSASVWIVPSGWAQRLKNKEQILFS